jgi:hypothetical protein
LIQQSFVKPHENIFPKNISHNIIQLEDIKDFSFQDGKIHLFFYENEPIESLIFFITYGHG